MAYGKITKKQEEILEYIKDQIMNRGFPPAVREICEAVNLEVHLFCSRAFGDTGEKRLHPPGSDQTPRD